MKHGPGPACGSKGALLKLPGLSARASPVRDGRGRASPWRGHSQARWLSVIMASPQVLPWAWEGLEGPQKPQ